VNDLRARIHARILPLWRQILHEHTEPGPVAWAVFVGCVIGCTPLFGFHFFVCVAVAWVLRLNKVIVYGAANLSIPPMIPLLGFSSVQLGERILHGRWLTLVVADFRWSEARALAHRFFLAWTVGGLALGAAIGVVAGGVVYLIVLGRARPHVEDGAGGESKLAEGRAIGAAIEQARARYGAAPARFKWYARMKYAMDPCYRAIAPLVPRGTFTVDLGTGLGMLPVLLGLLGQERRALGVEWDASKVACGQAAADGLPGIELVEGDVRAFPLPACDAITLVDMLHYYDPDAQRALLKRCRDALRPGGRLLVREGDGARAGGARFTRAVEAFVTRLGWNRGPKVRFRPIGELTTDLEALGFAVRLDEVAGRMHPGNVLLVAEIRDTQDTP
jgi:uncharacterized protein (DUF2062 family)/SAM-dependent methyltransferase